MQQYLDLIRAIQRDGIKCSDRTGIGTQSLFGYQMRFDISEQFPLLTTKKLYLRGVIIELLWFLKGETNINFLKENNVNIWDEWADETGDLGPVYGAQWRKWQGEDGSIHDQISKLIYDIENTPDSRRLIVSAWNSAQINKMALPPCHCLFQFRVRNGYLDCHLYQRSADVFLGVPFNIASYALLLMMVAQVTRYKPGNFIHSFGDVHLYNNHHEQARLQLARAPRPLPTMQLNHSVKDIFAWQLDDFELNDYNPHPHIRAPIAV